MKSHKLLCATALAAAITTQLAQTTKAQEQIAHEQFQRLSCAVVRITHDDGATVGTGFFIDNDGTIVTAAHVVYESSFVAASDRAIVETFTPYNDLKIAAIGDIGASHSISIRLPISVQLDLDPTKPTAFESLTYKSNAERNLALDIAVVHTDLHSNCSLKIKDAARVQVGDNLWTLGYQRTSSSYVFYSGMLSAGPVDYLFKTEGKVQLEFSRKLLRVQMPIGPGVSGAPIIASDGGVVGVVKSVPLIPVPAIADDPNGNAQFQSQTKAALSAIFEDVKDAGGSALIISLQKTDLRGILPNGSTEPSR